MWGKLAILNRRFEHPWGKEVRGGGAEKEVWRPKVGLCSLYLKNEQQGQEAGEGECRCVTPRSCAGMAGSPSDSHEMMFPACARGSSM